MVVDRLPVLIVGAYVSLKKALASSGCRIGLTRESADDPMRLTARFFFLSKQEDKRLSHL